MMYIKRLLILLTLSWLGVASAAEQINAQSFLIINADRGDVISENNGTTARPIASITKLMTAMVVLDAHPDMDEIITITPDDIDRKKWSRSRVPVGARITRADALQLALMSSDNRAAHALARTDPRGMSAFVDAMNKKSHELGMHSSQFVDPTGLSPSNISTAKDVARLTKAAYNYETIKQITTTPESLIDYGKGARFAIFRNSNSLVREGRLPIELSKTGYINESGYCLTIVSHILGERYIIVLLDAPNASARAYDAIKAQHLLTREVANLTASSENSPM